MSPSPRASLLATICLFAATAAHAATITGTVTGRNGATQTPLSSMRVDAYDTTGVLRGSATTDATGMYLLTLPAGDYRVLAYDPLGAYATAFHGGADSFETTPVVTLSASSHVRIDFELVAAGSIAGLVRSTAGTPLAGVVVEAYNLSGTRRGFTTTDAGGNFNLTLPPGEFKIVAYDPGGVFAPLFHAQVRSFAEAAPVTVVAAQSTSVVLTLDLAATVRGTAVDAASGAPLPGVVVYAYTPSGALVSSKTTDATGAFVLTLAPGEYRFVAADPARTYATAFYAGSQSFAKATPVVLAAGESRSGVQIALARGGIVTGKITAAANGTPLPNITVGAYNADGTLHASATTAADGTYELLVAPGAYRIAASDFSLVYLARFYSGWSDFDAADPVFVAATQRVTGVDLALTRGGRFTGVVTSAASGQPIAGITVAAYDAAGILSETTTTAADGRYTLLVAPGAYRLVAYDDQLRYATAYAGGASFEAAVPLTVDAGATASSDFALHAGLKVSGQVMNAKGQPLDGIEIFALDLAGNRVGGGRSVSGAFAFAVLPGSYKFVAIDPARRYRTVYYDRVSSFGEAKLVSVSAGQVPPPISFVLESRTRRRSVRH